MSEHGAILQTYNQELVKCLEDLKIKRRNILQIITSVETEKCNLEHDILVLQDRLGVLKNNLCEHKALFESYDKTIKETETGFKKILETSQALLHLAKHEATKLDKFEKCENEIL